jgi:hypothetical protein
LEFVSEAADDGWFDENERISGNAQSKNEAGFLFLQELHETNRANYNLLIIADKFQRQE